MWSTVAQGRAHISYSLKTTNLIKLLFTTKTIFIIFNNKGCLFQILNIPKETTGCFFSDINNPLISKGHFCLDNGHFMFTRPIFCITQCRFHDLWCTVVETDLNQSCFNLFWFDWTRIKSVSVWSIFFRSSKEY